MVCARLIARCFLWDGSRVSRVRIPATWVLFFLSVYVLARIGEYLRKRSNLRVTASLGHGAHTGLGGNNETEEG